MTPTGNDPTPEDSGSAAEEPGDILAVTGEPVDDEPAAGEPVDDEPAAGESVHESPAPGESVHESPAAGEPVDSRSEWQRLSLLTVAVTAAWLAILSVGGALILLITGVPPQFYLPLVPIVPAVAAALDYLRWTKTRYRLTDERLELRSGILFRSHRSTPRDRIRSVDLTADLVYRIFRVSVLKVGTGHTASAFEGSELKLDPLPVALAEELRAELLRRKRPAPNAEASTANTADTAAIPGSSTEASTEVAAESDGEAPPAAGPRLLASLDPSWIRYAPLSFLTPVLAGAAVGGVFQVAGWFNSLPWELAPVRSTLRPFYTLSLPAVIVLAAVTFLVAGAVGAIAIWVESWWDYRLERESGVLRVRRGLLTSRSISLEEARLRGVEMVEPLPLRRLRAGSVNAVATGIETKEEQQKGAAKKALLPAAPLAVVHEVTGRVLAEAESPIASTPLRTHPRAARRRRLFWSLATVTVPALALVVLGLLLTELLLWLALAVAVVGYAVAYLLALDAYANLGHAVSDRYLLVRHGVAARRTVALHRSGVIGWKVTRTFFQRRAGLATVTATVAAGAGQYSAYDVGLGDGLAFAEEAVPGLLTPFLEPEPEPQAEPEPESEREPEPEPEPEPEQRSARS